MSLFPPSEFHTPSPEELGNLLPQLDVRRFVARGGMGAVYYAVQRHLEREVALKILPPQVGDEGFRQRFSMEAKAMARMNHPNLAQLYDFGEADGMLWMAQEWIDGLSFYARYQQGQLSEPEAVALVCQVCDGLAYAHRNGIAHRDVKPENIMWNSDGLVKVTDFGLAQATQTGPSHLREKEESRFLTQEYAAPEMFDVNAEIDHRVDIFALGVLAYEGLTGERPSGEYKPPGAVNPALQERFDLVLARALQRDPEKRYQNCSEFKRDFEQAVAQRRELEMLSLQSNRKNHFPVLALSGVVILILVVIWIALTALVNTMEVPEEAVARRAAPLEESAAKTANVAGERREAERSASTDPILPLGPALYYSFDNAQEGRPVQDDSGNGVVGTMHGAVPAPGLRGQGILFDGKSSTIEVFGNSLKLSTTSFTMSLWVRAKFDKTHGLAVQRAFEEQGQYFHLILNEDKLWQDFWGGDLLTHSLPRSLSNRWTQVAFSFDTETRESTLYVNGEFAGKVAFTAPLDFDNGTLVFGEFQAGESWSYLDGSLDEILIYRRRLNPAEVKQIYSHGKAFVPVSSVK